MSKTLVGSSEPNEPEKPKTWEEQVAEYRVNYRSTLNRTVNIFTLPLRKAKVTFRAALTAK